MVASGPWTHLNVTVYKCIHCYRLLHTHAMYPKTSLEMGCDSGRSNYVDITPGHRVQVTFRKVTDSISFEPPRNSRYNYWHYQLQLRYSVYTALTNELSVLMGKENHLHTIIW